MSYPMTYRVDYPEKLSRGTLLLKVFFGWLYVGIPHGICLWLYGIAAAVMMFVAFFAILFTGKYPKGLFDFVVGYARWGARVGAYMTFMRDEYPPFSGAE
jgi:hypothetical protein